MSDLHELPDLAGDVRDRVVVPPYAEVSRRVRARRRRTAAGTLACAVLVVGGIAVGQQLATEEIRTLPRPAGSSGPDLPDRRVAMALRGQRHQGWPVRGLRDRRRIRGCRLARPRAPGAGLRAGDPRGRRQRARQAARGARHADARPRRLGRPRDGPGLADRLRRELDRPGSTRWPPGEPARPGDVLVSGQYGINRLVLARRPHVGSYAAVALRRHRRRLRARRTAAW